MIADFTNFNIVTSDSVTGACAPPEGCALGPGADIIMQAKNLGMQERQRSVDCAKDEINAKEKLEFEAQAAIQNPGRFAPSRSSSTTRGSIAAGLTGTGAGAGSGGCRHGLTILSPGQRDRESRQSALRFGHPRLTQVAELIQKLTFRCAGADRGSHRRSVGHLRQVAGRQTGGGISM